jgi:hypothetical protein
VDGPNHQVTIQGGRVDNADFSEVPLNQFKGKELGYPSAIRSSTSFVKSTPRRSPIAVARIQAGMACSESG